MGTDILIGAALSLVIALSAYLKKSLTKDGMAGAVLFGTLIYMFAGLLVWASLIAFFVSSSVITKVHDRISPRETEKNGRNIVQVISKASVATFFSLLFFLLQKEIYLVAAVVSVATSNSDTWASEIGSLSKGKTFSILNFRETERGVSGAVSFLGTGASLLGSLFIAVIFTAIYWMTRSMDLVRFIYYMTIIGFGGFLGCFIDSYLGALVQAKYKGVLSGRITEVKWLPDEKVILASGFALITNDAVNFLSSLSASVITVLLFAV